jgi:hypothetical protein
MEGSSGGCPLEGDVWMCTLEDLPGVSSLEGVHWCHSPGWRPLVGYPE